MSRPPERYDSSRKKCNKNKRKRFERPRFRDPIDKSKTQIAADRSRQHALKTDSYNTDFDPSTTVSQVEEKSLYSETSTECRIGDSHKQVDESSSTQDEFFDAQDVFLATISKNQDESPATQITVHLALKESTMNISIESREEEILMEIAKAVLEKQGVGFVISSNENDSPSMSVNLLETLVCEGVRTDWQSGDCPVLETNVHQGAQTTVVLGADEISESEGISIMSNKPKTKKPDAIKDDEVSQREDSPQNESFMMSETTTLDDSTLKSYDSAPLVPTRGNSSTDVPEELNSENQEQPKPISESIPTSIPVETSSIMENNSNQDTLPGNLEQDEGQTQDVHYSPPHISLIKSKSDSLVLSGQMKRSYNRKCERNILLRKESSAYPEVFSLVYNKLEENSWDCSGENRQNAVYCSSNEWIDDRSFPQEYGIDKSASEITQPSYQQDSNYNEEVQERPMTSAADAVKSMRQALKPISDQINDIRSKMIGMNIQPRTASHHIGQPFTSKRSSQDNSNLSAHNMKISNWLLTDPQEFSSSHTNSEGSFRAFEYLVDDFASNTTAPQHFRQGKLVIFPGDLNDYDFNYICQSNLDELSLTRSSIVTEPEDIFKARCKDSRREM